jgi:hypothetical protein
LIRKKLKKWKKGFSGKKKKPPANGVVVMSWVKRKVVPLRTRRRHVSELPRVTTTTIGAVNALGAEREREREREREWSRPEMVTTYVFTYSLVMGVWSLRLGESHGNWILILIWRQLMRYPLRRFEAVINSLHLPSINASSNVAFK